MLHMCVLFDVRRFHAINSWRSWTLVIMFDQVKYTVLRGNSCPRAVWSFVPDNLESEGS